MLRLEMTFWHFFFAVQVSGGVPKGEGSGGLTLRLEAGSKAGQDLREKIKEDVMAKINEWKANGERAINDAKAALTDAEAEFSRATGTLEAKQKILTDAQRTAQQTLSNLGCPAGASRRLLSQGQAALGAGPVSEDVNELALTDRVRAAQGAKQRFFGHRWHVHHRHRPHLHHRHHPHIHVTEPPAIKAALDAKILKDAKDLAKKACDAARKTAQGAIEVAKGPLEVAKKSVDTAQTAVNQAQKGLDSAKTAWKGVFNIMEGAVTAVLGVEYLMLEATLKPNVLDSCLSGEMRYSIGSNNLNWKGSFCMNDLAKVVGDLFQKCVESLGV